MIFFFNYLRRATQRNAPEPPTFEAYIARRKQILTQVQLQPRHLEKIQSTLLLEYLIEHFLAETLSEKTMSCYNRYFREMHACSVETILKCPENLRTIICSMASRNEAFLFFLLECLYVVRQNSELNRAILEAIRKCNADKFLAKKLSDLEFLGRPAGFGVEWEAKLTPDKMKFVDAALQILTMALCKTNPVAQTHFVRCAEEKEKVRQLVGAVMKLICQREVLSLREEAESVFEAVVANLQVSVTEPNSAGEQPTEAPGTQPATTPESAPKTPPTDNRASLPDDRSDRTTDTQSMELESAATDQCTEIFSERVVDAIQEANLIQSTGFFRICALFVRTKSARIISLLFNDAAFTSHLRRGFEGGRFGKKHAAVLTGMLRVVRDSPQTPGADDTDVYRGLVRLLQAWGVRHFRRDNLLSAAMACLLKRRSDGQGSDRSSP